MTSVKVGDVLQPGDWKLTGRRGEGWDCVRPSGVQGLILDSDIESGTYFVAADADLKQTLAARDERVRPFLEALDAVWAVQEHGAKKYSPNNCFKVKGEGLGIYEDALWRHWFRRRAGERIDPDSGELHLAHMAWNALFLLLKDIEGEESPEWADPKGT